MIFLIPVIGLLCTTLILFWLYPNQVKTGKLSDLYSADSVRTLAGLDPKSLDYKLLAAGLKLRPVTFRLLCGAAGLAGAQRLLHEGVEELVIEPQIIAVDDRRPLHGTELLEAGKRSAERQRLAEVADQHVILMNLERFRANRELAGRLVEGGNVPVILNDVTVHRHLRLFLTRAQPPLRKRRTVS